MSQGQGPNALSELRKSRVVRLALFRFLVEGLTYLLLGQGVLHGSTSMMLTISLLTKIMTAILMTPMTARPTMRVSRVTTLRYTEIRFSPTTPNLQNHKSPRKPETKVKGISISAFRCTG